MAKRYQRAIRSCKSKEGQTTQWPKDTKGQSEAVNGGTDNTIAKRYQGGNQKASDCPLVSFGHCVVCPSFDLRLLIVLWYLLAIVLSVLPLIYGF
jgi:hypothetical protein